MNNNRPPLSGPLSLTGKSIQSCTISRSSRAPFRHLFPFHLPVKSIQSKTIFCTASLCFHGLPETGILPMTGKLIQSRTILAAESLCFRVLRETEKTYIPVNEQKQTPGFLPQRISDIAPLNWGRRKVKVHLCCGLYYSFPDRCRPCSLSSGIPPDG